MVEPEKDPDEDKCMICKRPVPEVDEGFRAICPGCAWQMKKPKPEPIPVKVRPRTLRRREGGK